MRKSKGEIKMQLPALKALLVLTACFLLSHHTFGQHFIHMGTTRILNGVSVKKDTPRLEVITETTPPDGLLSRNYYPGNPSIIAVNGDSVVRYNPLHYDDSARTQINALKTWFATQIENHTRQLALKRDGCLNAHVCKCIIARNGYIASFEYRGTNCWEADGIYRSFADVFSDEVDRIFLQLPFPFPIPYQKQNVAILLPDSFFDCEVCIHNGLSNLLIPGNHAAQHMHYTAAQ